MPLYEYECERCGHRFEKIQKFSDPLVEACPVCGGPVRKLLSSPAIQFKGSGWYITDYAKKDTGGAATDAAKKSDTGDAASKTTEQKGEPAADTKGTKEAATKSAKDSKKGSKTAS